MYYEGVRSLKNNSMIFAFSSSQLLLEVGKISLKFLLKFSEGEKDYDLSLSTQCKFYFVSGSNPMRKS